jgi:sialidase-1
MGYPDYHPEIDLELLRNGWAIGHVECLVMLGCDRALDIMDAFYEEVTARRGLSRRPAFEAISRGGLQAYRYAARRPDRVACIYGDTPVMDLKSWPLGLPGAAEIGHALQHYGFKDEADLRSFRGNPVDLLAPIARARIPLRHVISLNDAVVPPEQNTLEAQRRLQAMGWDIELVQLQEGTPESRGHHFALPAAFESARFIMRHTTVLPNGREYFALRDGLGNSLAALGRRKKARVAFLGGSITHAPGWRDTVAAYLRGRFPATELDVVPAGIPSLGSVPHAFRLERDVLMRGAVDLIFVEAAVNDHNYDGQPDAEKLALRGMEGIVRHLRAVNPETDIVILHFIHPDDFKTRAEGKESYTIAAHEAVAEHYGCPSLNLSREVCERIEAGQFTWERDFLSLHPSPYGQQVYANSITRMLDAAYAEPSAAVRPRAVPAPLDAASYSRGRFGDIRSARVAAGFRIDPNWKPADGMETREGYVNVPMLVGETPGSEFEFEFDGTAAGLMITSGPDAKTIECSVDGGPWRAVDTGTPWSIGMHIPWAILLADGLADGPHAVRVRVRDGALRVVNLLLN